MALNDTLKTRILLRNDQLSSWGTSQLVLGKGEIAIATGITGGLAEVRVGTGTSTWATSEKLKIDTAQVSGLTELIESLVGNGAKKYKVVANGADGNGWKLQEAPLSAADDEWTDVAGSTAWTVDFSGLSYDGGLFGATKFVTKVTEANGVVSAEYAQPAISDINGLQTALDAKLDKTTFSTISNDIGLFAASKTNPVVTKNDIASLDKVMHFRGTVNAIPTSTEGYEVGDIVLVAGATGDGAQDNGKEYVLVNTGTEETPAKKWELIGDQNAISALTEYVDTQIENLSNAVTSDYATKTEVNDISDYLSGAIDDLGDEITSITGNYATKEYVNGISSELSTETSRGIEAAKSEVIGKSGDLSTANTVYGAKKYAEVYADGKIADLNINNYATKEYVNGISSSLSTDYVGKIKAVDDKLSNYALCADVTSLVNETSAATINTVVGKATDLSTADTINGAKAYADEKIAGLDSGLSDYIKHGECVQSDLSGYFILDCGGSGLRTDEPTA